MIGKKEHKIRFLGLILGCFFAVMGVLGGFLSASLVYAEDSPNQIKTEETEMQPSDGGAERNPGQLEFEEISLEPQDSNDESESADNSSKEDISLKKFSAIWGNLGLKEDCENNLKEMKWLVCTMTDKVTQAIDWLYGRIDGILTIDPVKMGDDSPIYNIWTYFLTIANVLFIVFLLVMIFSQITGYGINNYGIKKALPKLIVAAVLINLSFYISSLIVDVSNIVGDNMRGTFAKIADSAVPELSIVEDVPSIYDENGDLTYEEKMRRANSYGDSLIPALLGIGAGVVAFESGMIWMLIPVALGALTSVVVGLITIALRQALVMLLIMVSPIAIMAYIFPNTESLYKKWWGLLKKMLLFYPMFSLLFGASNLAGFAIIMSANDGFGALLGMAVQIFPLFYSWKLMKMSGTILGAISSKLSGLAMKPLMMSKMWAMTRRQDRRWNTLVNGTTPSARLMQYMEDRKIARIEGTKEHMMSARTRGLAYMANRHYKANGVPSREGERAYAEQARNMEYQKDIMTHKDNMNKGLGQLEAVKAKATEAQKVRLGELDARNLRAADALKMEASRAAVIDYENSRGYVKRTNDANFANEDLKALREHNTKHRFHKVLSNGENLERYEAMKQIMEGNEENIGFILADAAHSYNAQSQIVKGKFSDHFNQIVATQDVVNELSKYTRNANAPKYIDPIIAGLRTLNMRGDTNLIKDQLVELMKDRKLQLGTQASQAIASFCMFDVKGSDPTIRRFGKYLNMETARMYDENVKVKRNRKDVSFYEYMNGEYAELDRNGKVIVTSDGTPLMVKTKTSSPVLLKGTSVRDIERTGYQTLNELIRENAMDITVDANGNEVRTFNFDKFMKSQKENWKAISPNALGDHLSYLSGSEQITSFSKLVTGVDPNKHAFDWKGILGEDIAPLLTDEQKMQVMDLMHERTKDFLGAQVPVHIARTKSDMLGAIANQYVLYAAMESDPELKKRLLTYDYDMTKDNDYSYASLKEDNLSTVKSELQGSYKENALKGFVKMYDKGYQGEAKEGLIELLDPEGLYKKFFPKNTKKRNNRTNARNNNNYDDDDEEEDNAGPMMSDDDTDSMDDGGPIYNDTRRMIEDVFRSYTGNDKRLDVSGYWEEVKNIINSSDEIGSKSAIIDGIEAGLSQYVDVSALHDAISRNVFGGYTEND